MNSQTKKLHIPVEHTTLANGLRVVVSPDRSAPVVTVGVYYQIGFRLEPQGRSGFAHLFEHMMFQGSENAGKMEHIRLINSSGGVLNGTTNYDITNYFESVPSNALERVLWLEADRMRALQVDDENLRNQRDVVKEEVRVNVMNQPYGGFPWLDLPPVAFRNWPNAHNFYGDFADLDAATLADVRTFFHTYYAPNNAVLLMLGDLDPAEAIRAGEAVFRKYSPESVRAACRRDRAAADRRAPRRSSGKIRHAARDRHRLHLAAAQYARLVRRRDSGSRAARRPRGPRVSRTRARKADCGGSGRRRGHVRCEWPHANGHAAFSTSPNSVRTKTIAAFDSIIREIQEKGIEAEELDPVKVKFRADYFSTLEGGMGYSMPRFGLMHYLACFTLFDGDPHRINTILDGFLAVTPAEIQEVAKKYLVPKNRAVLVRRPVAMAGAR